MSTLENGQTFERYQITRWLGSGNAGESYEAEDRTLLRKVTLKLIHPWTTLPDSARRQFFREMQGISTLNHPYLATVLDYGEVDGRIYVVRRYASSGSLLGPNGRLWFHAPLIANNAFRYTYQIAQALQYIHQHGYVHGSLTFANVLVLRGPNVENEADYAPFLVADMSLTNFVRRFGNPQIDTLPVSAAPEQAVKQTTPASDQFALAVLLYFWLAGRLPYLGTPDEVEQLKLTKTIPLLSTLNPAVNPEQDTIILRALAASPKERYPSVMAFAEALMTSLPTQTVLTSTFIEQPETPREILYSELEDVPTATLTTDEAPERQPLSAVTSAIPSEEQPPDSLAVETPGSPLEQLLSISQRAADSPAAPGAGSPTNSDQEPATAFPPAIPETPGLEETSIQTEYAPSSSEEPVGTSEVAPPVQQMEPVPAWPRVIISSPYASDPSEFLLTSEETNVGRAGSSDLLLEQDDLTSRHHALLKRVGERILIFDKRSHNGVYINGQKIEVERGYELADGDHIGIGNYELIFRSALGSNVSQLI